MSRKIQLIIVDFQTYWQQKKTIKRKPVEANHFRETDSFQWKPFLFNGSYFVQLKLFFLMEAISFIGKYLFQWKPFLLGETRPLSGNRSFQGKPFFLVEAVPFTGDLESIRFSKSHSVCLVEAISSSGSYSFEWKPFPLVKAIPFRKSCSFQWKQFLLVETILLGGNYSFQRKSFRFFEVLSWKLILLSCSFTEIHFVYLESFFNGSCSLQWKPFRLFGVFLFSGSRWFQRKPCFLVEADPLSRSHSIRWKLFL